MLVTRLNAYKRRVVGGAGSVVCTDIEVHNTGQGIAGAHAGARFNDDGSIDQITDTTGSTFTALGFDDTGFHDNADVSTGGEVDHSGEWWTANPELIIGESYQIRVASMAVGTFNGFNDPGAVGTWVDIDTAPRFSCTRDGGKGGSGPGTTQATGNMEIRLKASPFTVLATFTLRCISHRT